MPDLPHLCGEHNVPNVNFPPKSFITLENYNCKMRNHNFMNNYHNFKTIHSVSNFSPDSMADEIGHLRKSLYLSIQENSLVMFNHVLDRILAVSNLSGNPWWQIDEKWRSPLLLAIMKHPEMALKLINNGCRIDVKK